MVPPSKTYTLWFFLILLTQLSVNIVGGFQTTSRPTIHRRKISTTQTATLLMAKLSSYESLLEFNAQFKQGIKYVLVPQAPKTGTMPGNYYDGAIPETLEAPIVNSAMDYTAVGNSIPAASTETNVFRNMDISKLNLGLPKMNVDVLPQINLELSPMNIDVPQINVEMPSIPLPTLSSTTDTLNAMGRDVDQLLQSTAKTVAINSDKLDAMGRDVDRVLQAARAVVSSSVEIAANMPIMEVAAKANTQISTVAAVANTKIIDPVVDRTMAQIKYAITHPPDFTDFTIAGAPPGQGLATPILDAIGDALRTARDSPPLFLAEPTPDDYRTIAYGFQAKVTTIENVQQIQTAIYNSAQQIAANNAVVQEEVKKLLANEIEQSHVRNAIIAEKMAAQSQLNMEYLQSSQDAFANQILNNAQAIQNQFHISEWTSRLEQSILKGVQSSNDAYPSEKISNIIASLKVEEYGGWYAGAILGTVLVQLAQNDKQTAIRKATEKLTIITQKQIDQANIEKQRLEGMVVELTKAVGLLTDELCVLKSQGVKTNAVLSSVQQDVKYVINEQLTASMTENQSLRQRLESTQVELQSVKDANNLLSSQTTTPIQPRPPQSPPPAARVESDPFEVQNVFFATTTDAAVKTGAIPVPAPVPKKTILAVSSTTSVSVDTNDWSNLSFSLIKRKPMTEIMTYLQAKGRSVIGADGKPLSKSQLVDAVFSS